MHVSKKLDVNRVNNFFLPDTPGGRLTYLDMFIVVLVIKNTIISVLNHLYTTDFMVTRHSIFTDNYVCMHNPIGY